MSSARHLRCYVPRVVAYAVATGEIEAKIHVIRDERVMLDFDLASLYGVPTKALNQQVHRNRERFPADFMFALTNQEFINLKSQIVTSSLNWGGRRKLPLAFTEQGVAMLSSVLGSSQAVQVNIGIMRAFVQMRRVLLSNAEFEKKLGALEAKVGHHDHQISSRVRSDPKTSVGNYRAAEASDRLRASKGGLRRGFFLMPPATCPKPPHAPCPEPSLRPPTHASYLHVPHADSVEFDRRM